MRDGYFIEVVGLTGPRRDAGPKACGRRPVAELVDALDSKSSSARSAGLIPAKGTKDIVPREIIRPTSPRYRAVRDDRSQGVD